jgi:hypothetical protein
MNKILFGIACAFLVAFAAGADAQSVANRVPGAVSGAGSIAGGATSSLSAPGLSSSTNPTNGLPGSTAGGDLPGALGIKAGDRVIQFRGAAGIGDDRGSVRAGVGIPF